MKGTIKFSTFINREKKLAKKIKSRKNDFKYWFFLALGLEVITEAIPDRWVSIFRDQGVERKETLILLNYKKVG
jgi:hypothetical protein